ncbi:flagellar hook-length control protein FliK [Stieleria sp. JC731]|uniref:flagellar hook-length control protein FliK n=1 Tax=Pirellulaceae TaxID=2691357 RepID=UPI001E285B46|nr:flagellar hook-length control protein FliK [Stieleria sp. JC731]MCC9602049.1 flagellar hook-length control protein FliK [Stieleria sp. JC731]
MSNPFTLLLNASAGAGIAPSASPSKPGASSDLMGDGSESFEFHIAQAEAATSGDADAVATDATNSILESLLSDELISAETLGDLSKLPKHLLAKLNAEALASTSELQMEASLNEDGTIANSGALLPHLTDTVSIVDGRGGIADGAANPTDPLRVWFGNQQLVSSNAGPANDPSLLGGVELAAEQTDLVAVTDPSSGTISATTINDAPLVDFDGESDSDAAGSIVDTETEVQASEATGNLQDTEVLASTSATVEQPRLDSEGNVRQLPLQQSTNQTAQQLQQNPTQNADQSRPVLEGDDSDTSIAATSQLTSEGAASSVDVEVVDRQPIEAVSVPEHENVGLPEANPNGQIVNSLQAQAGSIQQTLAEESVVDQSQLDEVAAEIESVSVESHLDSNVVAGEALEDSATIELDQTPQASAAAINDEADRYKRDYEAAMEEQAVAESLSSDSTESTSRRESNDQGDQSNDSPFGNAFAFQNWQPRERQSFDASGYGFDIRTERSGGDSEAVASMNATGSTLVSAESPTEYEGVVPLDEFLNGTPDAAAFDQVSDSIGDAIESAVTDNKSVYLEVSPKELGFLTIEVSQLEDSVEARIVASEMVTSEILLHHREQLVESLNQLGYESFDVNISYDERQSSDASEQQTNQRSPFQQQRSSNRTIPMASVRSERPSGLDIVA